MPIGGAWGGGGGGDTFGVNLVPPSLYKYERYEIISVDFLSVSQVSWSYFLCAKGKPGSHHLYYAGESSLRAWEPSSLLGVFTVPFLLEIFPYLGDSRVI